LCRLDGGEVAGPPHVPACDGAPGRPFFGAALHFGGGGEEGWGDFGFRLEALEGEGETFADAVVAGGENVGAAEAEHQHHFDCPFPYTPYLRQVRNDGFVGHATDLGERGDGAVEGFGGEVAEGECLVVGEAGGAELVVGGVEDLLGIRVDARAGDFGEGCEQAGVDGGGCFAVELLVDDRLQESFEGRLLRRDSEGERAGFGDELREFGIGGGERGDGGGGVVGKLAGAAGFGAGHVK
jgi:hypothetical protein